MLQVKPKPPVYGELKEGALVFTFLSRLQSQRAFEKDKAISVQLHSHHLGEIIAQSCNAPSFEFSVPSEVPHCPVKISCSLDEEGKVVIEATQNKPSPHSVVLKASKGDFKVLQTLIEAILPELYHWTHSAKAPSNAPASTTSSINSVAKFFSYNGFGLFS